MVMGNWNVGIAYMSLRHHDIIIWLSSPVCICKPVVFTLMRIVDKNSETECIDETHCRNLY